MIKRLIALILPIMMFYIGPVYADQMVNMEEVMSMENMPKLSPTGNIDGVYFTMNNEGLHLKTYFNQYTDHYYYRTGHEDVVTITGGYVKLLDTNDVHDYLSFSVDKYPYFRVYKLTTETGKNFLLIIKGKQYTSECDANGVWLIGKQDGKYVTYATLDNLQGAGLVFQDIIPRIENGELRLIGVARDRDCNIWGRNTDQPPYTYKGHPVSRTEMANKGECVVSSVNLFWDDNANWFGIRYAE